MKIMVISDIHGSFSAVSKAISIFKKEKFDKMLILGDILYHGPRNDFPEGYNPKEVFAALNQIKDKIICVRGNCDAEVDQMVLEFPIMAEYINLEVGEKSILATHGHKLDSELKPLVASYDMVLSGHTHLPVIEKVKGVLFVNPGSIALPKGDYKPSYGIIESSKSLIKTSNKITIKTFDDEVIKSSSF